MHSRTEEMYRERINKESNHLVFNELGRTNWKIKEHRSHYTQVRICFYLLFFSVVSYFIFFIIVVVFIKYWLLPITTIRPFRHQRPSTSPFRRVFISNSFSISPFVRHVVCFFFGLARHSSIFVFCVVLCRFCIFGICSSFRTHFYLLIYCILVVLHDVINAVFLFLCSVLLLFCICNNFTIYLLSIRSH